MPNGPGPGLLAQVACILEVTARKPGNVHPGACFDDATALDFYLSAAAIAGPLDRARSIGVGAAVLEAIEATRRVVATNTNLGMVLLLAPLAAVPEVVALRPGVADVLAATTVEDARLVYRAIRMARPGGLGQVADQDVADEPTITLRDAMRLAAGRDLIARQYAEDYVDVFDLGLPALRALLDAGRPLEPAIIRSFLTVLARRPDTLILRKRGPAVAAEASRQATAVLDGTESLAEFDAWLRADGHARNPGATADLVAAALFVALTDGTIPIPRPPGPAGWSGRGDGG
jgi:triphosphoribosyl-dephospho-CoA synthase